MFIRPQAAMGKHAKCNKAAGLAGMAMASVAAFFGLAALAVVAQAQGVTYNWVLTKGAAANGGGGKLEILVPPSNGVLGRFACVDNQGNGTYTVLTLAANVGQLKSGAPAQVALTTPQGKYDFNGLVVEPATGGGIRGITFSIANNHPVWPSLAHGPYVDYQVKGYTGSRLDLGSSGGRIGQFAKLCGFTPPGLANNAAAGQGSAQTTAVVPQIPTQAAPAVPQTAPATPGGEASAEPQQPTLPLYQTRPGRSAWRNRNYRIKTGAGRKRVYTAEVTNGGLTLQAYCTGSNKKLRLFITRSGNEYPAFEQRIRQAIAINGNFEFAFDDGNAFRSPMVISPFTGPKGELIVDQASDASADLVSQLLSAVSVSITNPPFGASFQLRGSKNAICRVLRRCGAQTRLCGGKSRATSGTTPTRCRPRSVYVPGRGCILRKFAK